MNKRHNRKLNTAFLTVLMMLLISGCGFIKNAPAADTTGAGNKTPYGVYYLSQDESQILFEGKPELTERSGISDYILALQSDPSDVKLKKTLGSEVLLIDYRKEENGAVLNFEERYYDMKIEKEVLFRAAAAQTVLQDSTVDFVSFEVNGEPLKHASGEEVGSMTRSTFIDNAGDELSSYLKKRVKLFFADSEGSALVMTEKDMVFSSNESLEKVVMEQLIAGPGENEGFATISPDTKINTIAVKNGICYVSLDTALVDKPVDVTEETLLYSIVNTLTSVPGVSRVQISVNGETDRVLRSNMRLDEVYSYNEEIVHSD